MPANRAVASTSPFFNAFLFTASYASRPSVTRADAVVEVSATATCAGKTGVEMEALTAAAVSGLTIYDMCKAVSKDIVIERVRLESKIGGKSGEWRRSTRPRSI